MVRKTWIRLVTQLQQPEEKAGPIQKFFKTIVNKEISVIRTKCEAQYKQKYDEGDTLYTYCIVKSSSPNVSPLFQPPKVNF